MRKLMLIDENSAAPSIIGEVLNFESRYRVFGAAGRIEAEDLMKKERPELIMVNTDSESNISAAAAVSKLSGCPDLVFFGAEKKEVKLPKKPLDEIKLPFNMEDFCERIEDAYFTALGLKDPITGLFKKQCFDVKLERLMAKKTDGVYFSMGLNAYSFAANPPTPLQIQMSVYALQNKLEQEGALFGLNGNIIVGFLPSVREHGEVEKLFEETVSQMCEAAGEPQIFVTAGISYANEQGYYIDDMLLNADRGMGLSRSQGCNKVMYCS
ncbi:MAG: hypothetical protein NC203_05350 [Firmicutes bacterium]|nr:hypothetical protein [[Eubacterium] siraeum]MCM1487777.1 hypothetical protein [Bacillota bacterium]